MHTSTTEKTTSDAEMGQRITEALLIKGKSAKLLAAGLGISYSTMLRTLRGERSLTLSQVETASHIIGVSASSLIPTAFTK